MTSFLPISPIVSSILVLVLPLLAFVLQAILGKRSVSGNLALAAIAISTGISLFGVFLPVWNETPLLQRWAWFTIGDHTLYAGILLNNLTVLIQLLVCIIALPVHIYSRAYMKGDSGIHRYWMYLSLFCFAMLGLTVSANLLQTYIFWELVGFASYLLIGFWFTKASAVQANKKAFIINRIGDIGFLIGIALVYTHCKTLDLAELFGQSGLLTENIQMQGIIQNMDQNMPWITVAGLAFFLGAMAKSAQFPLHVWLPDAMEGPTAVSSLIHAATMVAAGVFLLCTVFPIFNATVLLVIAIIGTLTALTAAIFALGQYDIKKVLAFSTVSQLGFMMVGVGIGAWDMAMFHLITHAFFKCLLFLCAGSVIHEMNHIKEHRQSDINPQDMRHMGGLRKYMPKTFILMSIAALALAGFPFTSGFLSKDAIVVSAFEWAWSGSTSYLIIPIVLVLASVLTAFYIGRLIFKTFFGTFRSGDAQSLLREAPRTMLMPMFFLTIGCLFPFFGLSPSDYHVSWVVQAFHVQTDFLALPQAHIFIPTLLTVGTLLSWFIAWRWYVQQKYPLSENNKWVHFAHKQGYMNELNEFLFVKGTIGLSRASSFFDRYVVDGLTRVFSGFTRRLSSLVHGFDKYIVDGLVNLIAQTAYYIGHLLRRVQNGQLQGYLGFALTIVVLGILYLIIK